MADYRHIQREFGPVFDEGSRILILGSFPSVKSREANFFYGHPQNRFWPLLGQVLGCEFPPDSEGKRALLLEHHVALWDVLDSCDIRGSSDSSIRNAAPVDIMSVLQVASIRAIYCNGTTSHALYTKYLLPITAREAVKLPSTSPANAAWSIEQLFAAWVQLREWL